MEITLTIPDDIAAHMLRKEHDPVRELLELSVLSALRHARIYESEAVALLGMDSRFQLWEWLKQVDPHGGPDTVESVEDDLHHLASIRQEREINRQA